MALKLVRCYVACDVIDYVLVLNNGSLPTELCFRKNLLQEIIADKSTLHLRLKLIASLRNLIRRKCETQTSLVCLYIGRIT